MSTPKTILIGQEARDRMLVGINELSNLVSTTMGARGRNVVFGHVGAGVPVVTKDGVSVAKEVNFSDIYKNTGAQMVKEVALRANKEAGDGTTTSIVLANALCTLGNEALRNTNINTTLFARQLAAGCKTITRMLSGLSKPCHTLRDLVSVATISTNGDDALAEIIAGAMLKVGATGGTLVNESAASEVTSTVLDGYWIKRGYHSNGLIDATGRVVLQDGVAFIFNGDLSDLNKELASTLFHGEGPDVLFIANNFDDSFVSAVERAQKRSNRKYGLLRTWEFGVHGLEQLRDLAIYLNTSVITQYDIDDGVDLVLGQFASVISDRATTTILPTETNTPEVLSRIELLNEQLASTTSPFDMAKLSDRIAKLKGKIAKIEVGGHSRQEVREVKDRVDDAVNAVRAAMLEGIIAGGGAALVHISDVLTPSNVAEEILFSAIRYPAIQILRNAGFHQEKIDNVLLEMNRDHGIDVMNDDVLIDDYPEVVNLITLGIVDPAKVTRVALQNAVSVAAVFLTTEAIIHPEDTSFIDVEA